MNNPIPPNLIYESIKARFDPVRADDLVSSARSLLGKTLTWTYAGTNDDNSPYPLQRTYLPISLPTTGWMPECDLDFIEVANVR